MYIDRIQVEEGFLSGLDLEFGPGLNVIIGARGTGKTSIIELVRYALSAPAFTDDALKRGNAQAASVLQGGRVAVSVRSALGVEIVERDASGPSRRSGTSPINCTVLAQNEIESVGSQPIGRLHLIDRFRSDRPDIERAEMSLRRQLQSETQQISNLIEEGTSLSQQIQAIAGVSEELRSALQEQTAFLRSVQATEADRKNLNALQAHTRELGAQRNILARSVTEIDSLSGRLRAIASDSEKLLEEWPAEAGSIDLLQDVRSAARSISELLGIAQGRALEAADKLQSTSRDIEARERQLNDATRQIRQRLESLRAGASSITRRVQDLQEREGQLRALTARLTERRGQFQAAQIERDQTYAALEELRQTVYDSRAGVAQKLNSELAPIIKVHVSKSAALAPYASAIAAGLRGSGLHYNSLAPIIASNMTPLELVRAAENFDAAELGRLCELSADRAASVLSALRASGTGPIASAEVDDAVGLRLLDGAEYKDIESLSIGQRCTVVLPLLLSNHGEPLLVDQPEDHLDNAFIANTLVRSLRQRGHDQQLIFASHNANVPVLGEADRVIVLESDGRRGYVAHAGGLDDPDTRRHIENILEGGAKAFDQRAAFYSHAPGRA